MRVAATMPSADASCVTEKQATRNVTFETVNTMPIRPLNADTGLPCNRDVQVSDFMGSQQCEQLVSLCRTCNQDQQMDTVCTEISKHFQYATLSRRWGTSEPSLRDIEGQDIYTMPMTTGIAKLQAFYSAAGEWGYLWAWGNTSLLHGQTRRKKQQDQCSHADAPGATHSHYHPD
ncbi:hypothetical protein EDC04DRAFT_866531 [Pisolithus marmoratus]|nr:hypothetical protein EDC04DRAFT_866531 [Pisolithus marmoratus]